MHLLADAVDAIESKQLIIIPLMTIVLKIPNHVRKGEKGESSSCVTSDVFPFSKVEFIFSHTCNEIVHAEEMCRLLSLMKDKLCSTSWH
ncbi:unnamed protein product [Trifolium pratense]|uniref:Uncharacterized protein n=1 Tax=Trifolium pratense TaxID=57577 RepID=A0ACB0JXK7_TRIPR|nr:unnamed protein product [Trifolium pratense]